MDVTGYGYTQDDLPSLDEGPIDIGQWFDADRRGLPLELEVGSGKGTFLTNEGPARPDVNFVGLEYAKEYWRHAADRARRHALPNVRMVHIEAGILFRNYVQDHCLSQIHVYFPDPWPKARHHKRRFVQAPMLRLLHQKLVRPGEGMSRIRLATDHEDYFHWMEDHAGQVDDIFERLPFEKPASTADGELVGTNFERKYRREGRPFFSMILQARSE